MRSATNSSIEDIIHLRRGLAQLGYRPLAVNGKAPAGYNWPILRLAPNVAAVYTRQYPEHLNTGLITGELVGLDIDTPDPETATAICSMVPRADEAPYRVGKAPKVLYAFRATEPRSKRSTGAYLINGVKCQVEVLGEGNQFVGFGTHQDTGLAYEWYNSGPCETPLRDLPTITPDAIDELLTRAESYFAERGERIKKASKPHANDNERAVVDSDHPWTLLNQRALTSLDAWVPQLGLDGLRRYQGGYHSIASFRETNSTTATTRGRSLNIQPSGIVDYSDDNRGYSPIDLVEVCHGLQPHEAVDWLRERIGGAYAPAVSVAGLLAQPARRAAAISQKTISTLS